MKIPYPTAQEANNRAAWYYDNTQHVVDRHFNKILKKIKKISIKGKYELYYRPFFKLTFEHAYAIVLKLEKMNYTVNWHHGETFIISWNIL